MNALFQPDFRCFHGVCLWLFGTRKRVRSRKFIICLRSDAIVLSVAHVEPQNRPKYVASTGVFGAEKENTSTEFQTSWHYSQHLSVDDARSKKSVTMREIPEIGSDKSKTRKTQSLREKPKLQQVSDIRMNIMSELASCVFAILVH